MPKKSGFFAAPKWTVRRVVKHLKEARISEILQDVYGVRMGTSAMLERYQEAVTEAVRELSREEMFKMKQLALQWNERAEPESVRSRWISILLSEMYDGFLNTIV